MKTVMKALLVILLLLLGNKIAVQTFYDMLRETMDSTYVYLINKRKEYGGKEKYRYNNLYEPYGYEPNMILNKLKLKKKKYNYKYELIGDYDARLRNDTICIYSFNTTFYKYHWPKKMENTGKLCALESKQRDQASLYGKTF